MSEEYPWRDEDTLRDMYVNEEMSTHVIADELQCSQKTVSNWLTQHGIEVRGRGDGCRGEHPWHDEETLRKMYVSREKSQAQIADELGTDQANISRWLDKLGIEARGPGSWYCDERPWKDEDTLRELYFDERLTQAEIADELECSRRTVTNWFHQHGIETRGSGGSIEHAKARVGNGGYIRWRSSGERCYVHQLLVIAEGADPHVVFDPVHEIHHKNGVKWDNRPDNLEVLTRSEHAQQHSDYEKLPRQELRYLYHQRGLSQAEIGHRVGCSPSTIRRWMKDYNIEARSPGFQPSSGDD